MLDSKINQRSHATNIDLNEFGIFERYFKQLNLKSNKVINDIVVKKSDLIYLTVRKFKSKLVPVPWQKKIIFFCSVIWRSVLLANRDNLDSHIRGLNKLIIQRSKYQERGLSNFIYQILWLWWYHNKETFLSIFSLSKKFHHESTKLACKY